ncbi:galactose-1-phosphate uridylyltransferase [Oscillatoriales cyanobacterium LEGE 11467]|uniref:Galactose-1-phosphate uridylyltransferase n=1 Tax=Zarconia navalis LEGE 11467 TaxID=1828826 RepID=A0A928VV15_9CYAN|nr:galactose-1-phosphate uridylyltransferase [Zarconia navalis]MBE9039813.1 galactose-1-phosphate uridylyltransferase [Zarconia navalis LEGE 11467]
MSELRHNLITGDWVVIATDRAKKPNEFKSHRSPEEREPKHRSNCPFCPGNEKETAAESDRFGDDSGWQVRVVQNRYPALSPTGELIRSGDRLFRTVSGVGFHEVIIEHPHHDVTLANLPIEDVANILRMYRQRYAKIRADSRVAAIVVYKNHGKESGASIAHPHSQLMATPIVPPQIRQRAREAIRFFDETGECLFCHTLADELAAGDRVVIESDRFVAFVPRAALFPFQVWIFPRRHTSSFDEITEDEAIDLAATLKTVLAKLDNGLQNPAYNYVIRSIPTGDRATAYFHWYVDIIPRLGIAAGFELGSGMFVNSTLPEENAAFLRAV